MIDLVINFFLIVSTIVAVSGAAIYVFFTKRYRYWEDLGVPGPEAVFFYGNTRELFELKVTNAALTNKLYKQYRTEKYVGYYNLWQEVVLLRDLELIKRVVEKDFEHFINHVGFLNSYTKTDSVFLNLFSQHSDVWKTRRNTFSKLFTPKNIKDYYAVMQRNMSKLMDEMESTVGQDLECSPLMKKFAVWNSFMILFGFDISKDEMRIAKLIENADVFASPPASTVVKMLLASIAPSVFKFFKINIFPPDVYNFFSDMVEEIIRVRNEAKVNRNDLFELIMKMMNEGIGKEKMEFDEAVGQTFLFFQASFDTMELSICHALLQLASHPDVQEKAKQEVDSVLKGSQNITYDHLSEMNYLDAVICESMRINPPIGVIDRVCNKPYKVNDGFTIQEGTVVMIPVLALQMDPTYYPEPEKFYPERFLNTDEVKKTPLMPFGVGPRICLGMRLGKLTLKLVLASIISRFLILQSEKMVMPMRFRTKALLFSSAPIDGFWIKLKKRDSSTN